MQHDWESIHRYSEHHSSDQSELLHFIDRQTFLKTVEPLMISGKLQGRFMSMVSHMLQPKRILEVGTFTGFSTLCFAEGLAEGGTIITIERDQEIEEMTRSFLKRSPYEDQITLIIGDGLAEMKKLEPPFDLIFIDADKQQYKYHYEEALRLLKIGGHILIDNVLWKGKVLNAKQDKMTRAIRDFNDMLTQDERVANVLIPLNDGLQLVRKL